MLDWHSITPHTTGRWPEILTAFGIKPAKLNRNCPCPNCGGKDRAHWFEREGRLLLYCRHGCGNSGEGNCVSTPEFLLQEHNRWSFPEMVQAVASYLGISDSAPIPAITPRKPIATTYTYPASNVTAPDKASDYLSRATVLDQHIAILRENTTSRGPCYDLNGSLLVPLLSPEGALVNLAAYNGSGVHFCAKGISFGATARMPAALNATAKRVLCVDYFAGWRLWWKLKGEVTVMAAIAPDNFIWMTRKMRDQFDAVALNKDDAEEYQELGFDVLELPGAY